MKRRNCFFIFLLSLLSIFLVVLTFDSVSANWSYTQDVMSGDEAEVNSEEVFPVAYVGTKFYSTITAALIDNAYPDTTKATIYVLPTSDIISKGGLDSTKKETYELINAAKTLTTSVTLGTNKTISLPYQGTTTFGSVNSSSQRDFADATASSMGTNLKNNITIAENVTLTIPSTSKIIVGGILQSQNNGLNSNTGSSYSQITMRKDSTINLEGTIDCYGYIKETYDAQGTANINLNGSSTVTIPVVIYNVIGGTASGNANSAKVFPFNCYGIVNISAKINCTYNSTIVIRFYFKSSSYSSVDTTVNLISKSKAMFLMSDSLSSITIYHKENLFISSSETAVSSGGSYINVLERVSRTTLANTAKKTYITVYGNNLIGSLSIDVGTTINTANFYLPLSFEYDITLATGAALSSNYRICFLPGSKVTVSKGATLTFNNHAQFLTKRKGNDDYILIGPSTTGANAPVQSYPVGGGEDSTPEIECELYNAKLVNEGVVNINAGFGGKIYSTVKSTSVAPASKIEVGSAYVNIGASSEANSSTCPRFYSITNALSTYGFFQFNAYLKQFNGSELDYNILTKGTYIPYANNDKTDFGWVATSASIIYETNGGSELDSKDIEITADGYLVTSSDLPSSNPTREHYRFIGWYLDQECTIPFTDTNTYISVILYAKWEPIDYDIVYHCDKDYNGDDIDFIPINENAEHYNIESTIVLEPASYSNYVFDGWYLDSGYTTKISIVNHTVLENLSNPYTLDLYGRWFLPGTETYTITYVYNNEDDGCQGPESENVISNNLINYAPPSFASKNSDILYDKYFDGWYFDDDTKYESYTQITGDTTLYAKWLNKNRVTIKFMGSEIAVKYLNNGTTFTIPDLTEDYGISSEYLAQLEKTGYDLKWVITGGPLDGNAYSAGDRITITNDWGEEIVVNYTYVAQKFLLSYSIGDKQTVVLEHTHDGNKQTYNLAAKASGSFDVYTGDTIKVTITRNSGTDSGGAVETKTNLEGSGPTYTVSGTGNPRLTTSDAYKSCFAPDTLITMADGSYKRIKDIQRGDMVKTLNHETGKVESRPIFLIEKIHDEIERNIIILEFDNGNTLEIVDYHTIFIDEYLNYVKINGDNYSDFIGLTAVYENNNSLFKTKIVNISCEPYYGDAYTICASETFNVFTNDILTVTPNELWMPLFDINNDYTFNANQMADDIAAYGIFTYDELSSIVKAYLGPDTFDEETLRYMFYATNAKYFKIGIGKGVYTFESLMNYMVNDISNYTD